MRTLSDSFFSTYQKVDGRKVTMGNEDSYPIVSVKDVRIIIFDCRLEYLSLWLNMHIGK